MYDGNLVFWLKTELNSMVDSQIDKSKIQDESQYYRVNEAKRQKLLKNFDFTQLGIPKEYLSLTVPQRLSIREFARVFCVDNSDHERYLSFVCHVGFCFERADMKDSLECKALMENYTFLKSLWQASYPTKFSEFESQKKIITEPIPTANARPLCKNCGSDNVVSNGINWYCKNCGKQFRKTPIQSVK